jgi:hypothetical protein
MKKLTLFSVVLFALFICVFNSCKKEELSSKKEILALIFDATKNADLQKNVLGKIEGTNVNAEVPFSVDVTKLIPTLELSPRATVSPEAGIVTDFTNPVNYTVTAEDKTTKVFTVMVSFAPAPYIGNWEGGPIDFGSGLMRINFSADASGNVILQLVSILTGEVNTNSIKGNFDPKSKPGSVIVLNQTHRWVNNVWVEESAVRAMRYDILATQSIKIYYSLEYPIQSWLFQLNLAKK